MQPIKMPPLATGVAAPVATPVAQPAPTPELVNAPDDAAAAKAGVPVGGDYRNGSIRMIRVS